jgi:hypothetical protein
MTDYIYTFIGIPLLYAKQRDFLSQLPVEIFDKILDNLPQTCRMTLSVTSCAHWHLVCGRVRCDVELIFASFGLEGAPFLKLL